MLKKHTNVLRPVNIAILESDIGDSYCRKLYGLIWKHYSLFSS